MTPTIRSATVEDADQLAGLRWEFRTEFGTTASRSLEAFVEQMRAFAADVFTEGSSWRAWVAEDGGRLVGCVWLQLIEKVPHPNRSRWERPIAYVTNMYVEPALRGGGLGAELLDRAVTFARERDVDGLMVWPSDRSRPFYERAGFGTHGAPLWLDVSGD